MGKLVFQDLTGKRFGKWKVESIFQKGSIRGQGGTKWNCVCECGKRSVLSVGTLNAGKSKSCGCSRGLGKHSNRWKGVGDIGGTYLKTLRQGAIRRKIPLNVSPEFIWQLYLKQDGRCALSGLPIGFESKNQTASLDRIDSSKGYIEGNIQWVHKCINYMKGSMGDAEFVDWVNKIQKFQTQHDIS